MSAIGEEQYEQEVLFSVLKDSSNILIRDHLRDQSLLKVDTDEADWSVRLVWDYVPTIGAALPLSQVSITRKPSRDGVAFRLHLPDAKLSLAISAFLHWFLQRAVALGKAHPEASELEPEVLESVAQRVVRMWQTGMSFSFPHQSS